MKQYWNNTKVICTIGPACKERKILKQMILQGMDIARFNFSHGKPEDHVRQIKMIKSLAEDLNMPVAILQDLPGPKIRIGALKDEFIILDKGQLFYLTSKKIIGTNEGVSVNYPIFIKQLQKNSIVYLNDGMVKLVVISKALDRVICSVLSGGRIYPKKGVSCPSQFLNMSAVTPYDLKCLKYGIEAGVDFIAVSFVQSAKDILKVKNYLKRRNQEISVIAKIERKVAFENIDSIIKISDAVMVARGDLGIEADLEEVPFLQKEIIRKANASGKPVITATQMLESMVYNLQPTRAEVTDIANAILDGTDALMLSEETAVGKYPLKTLLMMVKVAAKSEENLFKFKRKTQSCLHEHDEDLVESFSEASVNVARNIKAKAIVVPTSHANAISWLSRRRPVNMIVGVTEKKDVYKKLILFWGVYPILVKKIYGLDETLTQCVKLVKNNGIVKKNDTIVIMLTNDNLLFDSNIMEVRRVI